MARRFFYTALGVLALAAAYHLGAVRTEAQGSGTFAGIDVSRQGYVLSGPTPVESQSFGSIKKDFR